MKNKLLSHSFRKVKNNYKRFISLLLMSFLGVGFFAGIQATSPDMLKTLDDFLDKQNVYDVEVISNLGLTDDDITSLKNLSLVDNAYGIHEEVKLVDIKNKSYALRLTGLSEVNKPYLLDGKLPSKNDEIAVEGKFLTFTNAKIGDKITIDDKELVITGVVVNPLYFSTDRGTTNVGSGKVDYYSYVVDDYFDMDYYTSIYITALDSKKLTTNSKDYKKRVDKLISSIKDIKSSREKERYNTLYKDIINYYSMINVDLPDLDYPSWYINSRDNNKAYTDLIDASDSISKIAKVFPLIFYVIAVFISLISMMRMVEEDRTENGTLKALGFNSVSITLKYFIFTITATIIGGIIGYIVGFILIPNIIWSIYQMMFSIPYMKYDFNNITGILGLIICVICICGTAVVVSYTSLKSVPASLMRPKAPKGGKRIFLEKIKPIWNRLNFSHKIIIRNIFRYKSRVLATIFGIAGCTALILSGFGVKDALRDIVNYQFDNVFHYDRIVALKDDVSSDLTKFLSDYEYTSVLMDTIKIKDGNSTNDTTLIVSDSDTLYKKFISLNDINRDSEVNLKDGEIVISEKTAKLLNLKENDKITIYDHDNNTHVLKITAIIENYIGQYSYMNVNTYKDIIGEYKNNTILVNNPDDNFDKNILKMDEVASTVDIADTRENVSNMMGSLDSVVVVLITAAMMLAFVVLYNLSNINISERRREIATLKVLGFYNKEVDNYITRENIILTIIGIGLGLIGGLYLSYYLMNTCEPTAVLFVRHVRLSSYIISIFLTILFTVIVNILTHFSLKKIDMTQSLKNVE